MRYFFIQVLLIMVFSCSQSAPTEAERFSENNSVEGRLEEQAAAPVSKIDSTPSELSQIELEQEKSQGSQEIEVDEVVKTPKEVVIPEHQETPHVQESSSVKVIKGVEATEREFQESVEMNNEVVNTEEQLPKQNDNQTLYEYWNSALSRLVSPAGNVNYVSWKKEEGQLTNFLQEMSVKSVSGLTNKEQLAFWINLYNAATVKLILDHYPLKSITDINEPWDQKWIQAEGKTLSLNDIEHQIIRPKFKDARIHAAVNCAAVSCPKIRNEAYVSSKLDAQLNDSMKHFLLRSGKNKLGPDNLQLSKIFEWYGEDFGEVISYINKIAGKDYSKDTPISYLEYNWNLNK